MRNKAQQIDGWRLASFFRRESKIYSCLCYFDSNKRGEASDLASGSRSQAAGGPIKCAVLTGWVGALLGRCGSPAALWSEETASLGLTLRGWWAELRWERRQWGQRWWRGGVFRFSGLRFGVVVGLRSWDALLLSAPGVVVGGIADVVVDEWMGLLSVRVHFILAVTAPLSWKSLKAPSLKGENKRLLEVNRDMGFKAVQ